VGDLMLQLLPSSTTTSTSHQAVMCSLLLLPLLLEAKATANCNICLPLFSLPPTASWAC
jgi:hypothetical protein